MRRTKKFAALMLTGVLLGSALLTGCGGNSMGKTVVKVNNTKVGMDEMMYYIYQTEQDGNYYEELYRTYFGSSYWDMAYDEERTFRDLSKDETMNSAIMYTIFEEKAKAAGYALTDEEKEEIAADAQIFYDELSENQRTTMNLDVKEITAIQEKVSLANKYYDEIMDGLEVDEDMAATRVDIDECRQYDVEYIYIPNCDYDEEGNLVEYTEEQKQEAFEMISELLPEAMESEDFSELIPEDSEILETGVIGFLEGDEIFGATFEKEALALSNGQVTEKIVEEEDGYYIIKMIDDFSTENYDEKVQEELEQLQYEEFQKVYEQIKADYTIEINNSIWDEIVIGDIIYEGHSY